MVSVNSFVEEAEKVVGQPYCWGGNGETVGDVLRKYGKEKGQSSGNTEEMIDFISQMCNKDLDSIHLMDCSGTVIYILRKLKAYMGDLSAQGLYENCTPIKKPVKGALAFFYSEEKKKHNHVGICVDDKTVVHDYSTECGVIREPIADRKKWVDFGLPDKWIDFNDDTITLAKDVYVYNTAKEAQADKRGDKSIIYKSGKYFIFKTYENCTNITKNKNEAGGWVKNSILRQAEEW